MFTDRDSREAVANLIAAYRQAVQTVRVAKREDDRDAVTHFTRTAKKYRDALRAISQGADPILVHARATGSRPFARHRYVGFSG